MIHIHFFLQNKNTPGKGEMRSRITELCQMCCFLWFPCRWHFTTSFSISYFLAMRVYAIAIPFFILSRFLF